MKVGDVWVCMAERASVKYWARIRLIKMGGRHVVFTVAVSGFSCFVWFVLLFLGLICLQIVWMSFATAVSSGGRRSVKLTRLFTDRVG